ncbi:hypothetical protein I4U23_026462 [Adineta vaga]|nr:hypothetical protein I4U23_026462 [Adineta vaga]
MNIASSSITRDDHNERLKIPLNRFFSFHENTLSSVENRRRSINELISNLNEEDKTNLNETSFSFECHQCFKIFASQYGFNFHLNMYHPHQSILCPDCNITFRSHRALKNHQQRFHFNYPENLPNYYYLSSYLFLAFSTEQFSLVTKNACEQGRLPLGQLSSKLFSCQSCHLAFPCSNALKYHLLNKHEQYEYEICRSILHDIIVQVEENNKIVDLNNNADDSDNIESMKFLLAKQASIFGLVDKNLAKDIRCMKHEHHKLIFPSCQHSNRTCANLCLKYLSSYDKLIENYSYPITTIPKTNPFAQGSIVSKPLIGSLINSSSPSKDTNQKRTSFKRVQSSISEHSSSPQSKRRTIEQIKTNESKLFSSEQILISPKKSSSKINHSYARSLSSTSGNSSTSTRISLKNSRQSTSKRSLSPAMTLAVERSSEKRRQQREQRKTKASVSSSNITLKKSRSIEQENDDDDDEDNIIIPSKSDKQKRQREASNSSVEYVQVLNNEQQTIPSLNNIENFKLKTKSDEKDIILCDSPTTKKKVISSPNKNLSNGHQTPEYDEHVRVRCKICGDILEGRSRFSKHVLTMHSHLIKPNTSNIKQQQQQQQTTIVL